MIKGPREVLWNQVINDDPLRSGCLVIVDDMLVAWHGHDIDVDVYVFKEHFLAGRLVQWQDDLLNDGIKKVFLGCRGNSLYAYWAVTKNAQFEFTNKRITALRERFVG